MCDAEDDAGCCQNNTKTVKVVKKVINRRLGANQIPDSLINDPILAKMISSTLPDNYNFELHKTIFKIQSISAASKRIALQFPEGLLLFATTIAEILEKYTGCVCIIMGNVTYGACCADDFTAASLECDLLVHYGHSCLIPIQSSDTVKTLYVFVDIKIDLDHFIESVKANFEPGAKLGFVSTIQFVPSLQQAKQQLQAAGYGIELAQNQPLSPGEVLGCTAPQMSDVNGIIYLGDGRFHLEAAMIANPSIQSYRYDPYDKQFTREQYDHQLMKSNRQSQIEKAKSAQTFGIILSTLGRQGNPKIMQNVISQIQRQNKEHVVILLSEIFPDKLRLFDGIDCFIQIACPRLSIDWGMAFDKPLLTPYEAAVALAHCQWQEQYPMDFYSYQSLGNWTNNHEDNAPNHPTHRQRRKHLRMKAKKEMNDEKGSASAEISSIVRQSIMAKLRELNKDIDDEVPDYILLMIGNKRTRSQIRSELGLFMTEAETEHFCSWLFKILDKLHEKRKKYKNVSALDDEKPTKTAEYWRGKYDEAVSLVEAQKVEIDRLKHEILELKLAKEKSYQKRSKRQITDNLM